MDHLQAKSSGCKQESDQGFLSEKAIRNRTLSHTIIFYQIEQNIAFSLT